MRPNETGSVIVRPIVVVTDDPLERPGNYNDVLYYESHITVEPVFGLRLDALKMLAERYEFRVADLLKQNNEKSARDAFCSGRSNDVVDLINRMTNLVNDLTIAKFEVWRYKIEAILVDVRLKRTT